MFKTKDESGQALIELIIFLPLMFTLYSVIAGFANSINGSINQQKVTRAYFYYRAQNNSTIPKPNIDEKVHLSWGRFGMFFIGWKEYFRDGTSPVMPCYRVSIPMKAKNSDKCEEKYNSDTSQFIRVGTVYGMCGATFQNFGNTTIFLPDVDGQDYRTVIDPGSCLISQ